MSLYDVLGVARDASPDVIRSAYRKRAMACHPDVGGDRDEFERIQQAYDVLGDPDRRARYDQTGDTADQPDNKLSELSAVIVGAFDHAVGQMGDKFLESDLIKQTCNVLRENKRALLAQKGRAEGEKAKLQEMVDRLRFEGSGPDILTGALQQRARNFDALIRATENKAEVIDQAVSYLGSYGFQWRRVELAMPTAPIDYDAVTFEGLGKRG